MKKDKATNSIINAQYTLEDAIDKFGFGFFQFKMAAIVGFAYMSDYVEMMVLSILSYGLVCDWGITKWERATLTTVVFIGMMISGTLWGKFCDNFGRKTGLWACTVVTFYFGLLSSFAPTFNWILILRFMTGIGVGGLPQAFTLFSEFSPKKHRAKVFSMLSFFGPLGTCIETTLAIFIMPTYGWRYLLLISAIPLFFSCILCYWLPESAKFYLTSGQRNKAIKTLNKISKENKKALPEGELISYKVSEKRGAFKDLFSNKFCLYTPILWLIWFTNSFCYYGIVLLTAEIFQFGNACEAMAIASTKNNEPCNMHCLTASDYTDYFISSLAEFPAYIVTVIMLDNLGRRKTISLSLILFSIFVLLLNICVKRQILTIFFTTARFFITITFQSIYVFTPELYPTSIRALGLGTCSTMSRIGAISTPFVAQVLYGVSPRLAISLYGSVAILTAFCCLILPETKGKDLNIEVESNDE